MGKRQGRPAHWRVKFFDFMVRQDFEELFPAATSLMEIISLQPFKFF
jgi:hypothetical protein